jgi:hypothetical protein
LGLGEARNAYGTVVREQEGQSLTYKHGDNFIIILISIGWLSVGTEFIYFKMCSCARIGYGNEIMFSFDIPNAALIICDITVNCNN